VVVYWYQRVRRKARRAFSRSELLRRILREPVSRSKAHEPGILLIQIDGLAFRQFERAVSEGYMPFVRWLMQREDYKLNTFYSGLPSTTPAVQGELYYGVKCAVPAFGFLDRATEHLGSMYEADLCKAVEFQMQQQCDMPLLEGGSSWVNMYSGGADANESNFCGSKLTFGELLRSMTIRGILLAIVLYFPSVLRFLALFVWEHIAGVWGLIHAVYGKREHVIKELRFIISRVFIGTGLREVTTIGAGIDLARGLPIVHTNFLMYDERSHHRGPATPFPHRGLRWVDSAIRKLYREAINSGGRDYQVWVFSDHGQETVRSYIEEYHKSLGDVVLEGLRKLQDEGVKGFRELPAYGERAPWISVAEAHDHEQKHERPTKATPAEERAFTIAARGPVGHVYFVKPLSLEQKVALAKWLVRDGNIPGVLFSKEPGKAIWVHPKGETLFPEEAESFLPHPDPIRREMAGDVVTWCENKNSGDLLLLGWNPDTHPLTFPVERGSHAGPGIEETQGFVLLPSNTPVPAEAREFVRPSTLRAAALHVLGRKRLPSTRRQTVREGVRKLRVMTYNVHSCIGMDGRVSPARIARVIRSFDPDIVALQEVESGRKRSRGEDQLRMIAEELELNASFCCTVECGQEFYGHALLSRFPVEVLASGLFSAHEGRERRGALLARIQLDGQGLYFLNTHFGLTDMERGAHINELLGPDWLGKTPPGEPLIVSGDFNMMPGSRPYRRLSERVHDVQTVCKDRKPLKTFFAFLPFSRIDHIFVSDHFDVEDIRVPQNTLTRTASDHLPLIAELKLTPQPTRHQTRRVAQPSPATG
jgi:endonuclease/exonuclease/phosphatase family metal-dependent hydrolase